MAELDKKPWAVRNVPAAVRLYTELARGLTSDITEKDFSEAELFAIRTAIDTARANGGNTDPRRLGNKLVIGYGDYHGADMSKDPYGVRQTNVFGQTARMFRDPAYSAQMAIGMARYETRPDGGYVVHDRYDFNASPETVERFRKAPIQEKFTTVMRAVLEGNGLALVNLIGNLLQAEGAGGRKVTINLPPPPPVP